jgi:cytochrome c oxidase subunit I
MAARAEPYRADWRRGRITSWITTVDHKRIGILYIGTSLAFFAIAGLLALLMRAQLATPEESFITKNSYNELFTFHGTAMIFLFIVPFWAGLANYLVPLMIGARDMAFPRLNALSYWLYVFGGLVLLLSFMSSGGASKSGWYGYPPLSENFFSPGSGQDLWILSLHLVGISSLVGAINFVCTIHNMRAPGMSWMRLPLFVWTIEIYSLLLIFVIPVIATGLGLLLLDRQVGTHFFIPDQGGNAVLYQHLFWFFGHPEVYIIILPAMGVISEVIPVFARKPIFGYKAVAASTIAIAFLSMLVWAHHMFTTPTATVVLAFFMISSFTIAVPTGIKIFNWLATLWRGQIVMKTPLFFAAAFLSQFVIGGITGVIMAMFPVDWQIHDTYFIVAHFHYVLFGGSAFALFAALYYWFPKMSGRMLSESAGKLSFWLMFIGFNLTFLIQHSAGLSGMPRRIYDYSSSTGWTGYNLVSSIGSFILGIGVLVTVVNVLVSLKRGRRAGNDPWHGNTLEWFVASPPPANNFDVVPRIRSAEPMIDIRREVGAASTTDETVAQPVTPAI